MEFFATSMEPDEILKSHKKFMMGLDVIWCIDIIKTFITSFKKDVDYEVVWYKIAFNYVFKSTFIFDLMGSISFIVFNNMSFAWYFTRLFRFARLGYFRRQMAALIQSICEKCDMSKAKIKKVEFISDFVWLLTILIHLLACLWVYFGFEAEGGWLDKNYVKLRESPLSKIYISSMYWVTTTLTTVGYGDFKGWTHAEYVFTMFVELFGFMVFGLIMASINNVILTDPGNSMHDIAQISERVDIWLVKLDKMKQEKKLPKLLYDSIKIYIQTQAL
jgi:hypothetical protein